jgi:uncharacterized protein YggT (Ycf19 family)
VAALLHILTALKILVVADALLSWFLKPDRPPRSWTRAVLDPIYAPLRRALEPWLPNLDVAPLVALVLLYMAQLALKNAGSRRNAAD